MTKSIWEASVDTYWWLQEPEYYTRIRILDTARTRHDQQQTNDRDRNGVSRIAHGQEPPRPADKDPNSASRVAHGHKPPRTDDTDRNGVSRITHGHKPPQTDVTDRNGVSRISHGHDLFQPPEAVESMSNEDRTTIMSYEDSEISLAPSEDTLRQEEQALNIVQDLKLALGEAEDQTLELCKRYK